MFLSIALLLATALPATAAAHARTTHHYRSVIRTTPLSTANGYPAVGGTAMVVGTVYTAASGDGALVDRVTVTGHPAPNAFYFKGSEVAFFAKGTVRDTFMGTVTVQSDGSQQITATGRITGGTGRYVGAAGDYMMKATVPAGSTVLTGGSAGRFTY
jgi:hypothetical protein